MSSVLTIFRREISSYFSQPTAYAMIVIFLLFSQGMSFSFGELMRSNEASLEWSFFAWHPWIYMLLSPAVAMRLWSDEQRHGTIELIGTMPVSQWSAILGKLFAAATVWLLALTLTSTMWLTLSFLGEPDHGVIISGYVGSFLVCLTFLAISMLVSACTSDQVVCLIVSVALCGVVVLCSYDPIVRELNKVLPYSVVEMILSLGVWEHFRSLCRGWFRFQDALWFGSVIGGCLFATYLILSSKRL